VEGQVLSTISTPQKSSISAQPDGTNFGTSTDVFLGALPDSYEQIGVVLHPCHEFSKVCTMGFLNTVAHVQRLVDNYFRHMRAFLRAYIVDFIALDKTLE
jgi:hypothetical protein